MVSEQSCRTKKKKEEVPSPPLLCELSSLPDEMVLNCLARVSRLDLAALSMVSKSYRSLVVSPEFYETRSRMGCKEECVYVFVDTPYKPNLRCFILRRGKGNSFVNNRLIPIPSFPTPRGASFVSLDSGIYVIGGVNVLEGVYTTRVSFLDCRTHTSSYVPSMRVARAYAMVGVLDGKIYVFGGCNDDKDPSKWAEVFDPKMQTWSNVFIPDQVMNKEMMFNTVRKGDSLLYDFPSKEGIMWNDLSREGERLLYCCDLDGRIMWCDPWSGVKKERMEWRKVYGLDHLQEFFDFSLRSILFNVEMMADVWHCYMLKHGYKNGFEGLFPGYSKPINSGGNIIGSSF